MKKYSLAFVIEKYFEFGGLQRDMRRMALACAQAGHAITIFTHQWDGEQDDLVDVKLVDFKAGSNHQTIKKIERFVGDLKAKNDFDCIVGFNRVSGLDVYFSGDACLKAKLQRTHKYWLRFLPRYRTYLELEASVFGPASQTELMMISPGELEHFRRHYQTSPERIHLLPPGINRDYLTRPLATEDEKRAIRQQFSVPEDAWVLLTIGSGFATKGIDRALYALASLDEAIRKKCVYLVVGTGKKETFQAIARKCQIENQVRFMGGRQDVENFYAMADLLIHAARTENTGLTLLEALANGVPVLATEHCGYASYITEARGGDLCREPFDQEELNRKLAALLLDEPRRLLCSKQGHRYCQTANVYNMVDDAVEIIVNRAQRNRT